ncbi:putative hydrolase [Colletotrichum orbiculare MAFF 240422]|uniref:Hydrolase n=1 Tax=Colletotrichum orbiculare (strain 104-T / ATCC 96160 / CBS 514.97 / LARS 414 / MAFF 240422) TaxID=1213857 RepID=N4V9U0_COLOR|nr:putative hydrolase [Colletotrichum orbiculare MAFF 240422]
MDGKSLAGFAAVGNGSRPRTKGKAAAVAAALSVLGLLALVRSSFPAPWLGFGYARQHVSQDWSWSNIKPSRTLEWHPCFEDGGFDCARLDLPMDWLDPSDDKRVVLAIARIRATDRQDYKGPVIFNPGGPGGSGIWSLKHHGGYLQDIVGNNHDIVSFDPRGVGASIPRLECWSPQQREVWSLQDTGLLDAHDGALAEMMARGGAYSQACEKAMKNSGVLEHISTVSSARDMLEIVHQMGYEKLKYWGFSYGTILGGVFAAKWPEKIERLVSDGNVDLREWFNDEHVNFLRDTDKVLNAFYVFCHQAGPDMCAFWAATPGDIEKRLNELLVDVKKLPVVVPADEEKGPDVPVLITYSKVKILLSSTLYQPQYQFQRFSRILHALERRDGRPYYEHYNPEKPAPTPVCGPQPISPLEPLPYIFEGTEDAFPVIMCADHPPVHNLTLEEAARQSRQLIELSPATGSLNVPYALTCNQRTTRPKWRFDGPFEGETNHPILFIANKFDNITPLISARNNSAGFPGSRVLVQNSYGHTSLAAPSACTKHYIHAYFQNGSLPDAGTECEGDSYPFGENVDSEIRMFQPIAHL